MKTLVIHIGYPKTATSTIQDTFFRRLHEDGAINYLGKYSSKECGKLCEVWNPWACFVEHCVYNEKISEGDMLAMSRCLSDNVNVLSNEDFPISFFGVEGRSYLKESDPFLVPSRMSAVANRLGVENVKVVAVVREQCDAIYSSYVEGWRGYFRHEPSLDTFEKYLQQGLSKGIDGVFRMFFYYEVLSEYIRVFGKDNVDILLYEDLKYDRGRFCAQFLASIAPDKSGLLEEILTSTVKNKKRRGGGGEYITDDVTLYEYLFPFYKRLVPSCVHKTLRGSIIHKLGIRTLGRVKGRSGVGIEKPSDAIKNEINKIFAASNEDLGDLISMKRKLKDYGYIVDPL